MQTAVDICQTDVSQSQGAKASQSLRNENDLKPTPHDLENIFDTDEEIEAGDSVSISISLATHTCTVFARGSVQHYCNILLFITGSAVALHCVKAHRQSQWRSPNFNPL